MTLDEDCWADPEAADTVALAIPPTGCPACGAPATDHDVCYTFDGTLPVDGDLVQCHDCRAVFQITPDGMIPYNEET